MWRMERGDGLSACLVIGTEPRGSWAVWFLNDRALGMREFPDVGSAIQFSDLMQAQNWCIGWRLVTDRDDAPPED